MRDRPKQPQPPSLVDQFPANIPIDSTSKTRAEMLNNDDASRLSAWSIRQREWCDELQMPPVDHSVIARVAAFARSLATNLQFDANGVPLASNPLLISSKAAAERQFVDEMVDKYESWYRAWLHAIGEY